MPTRTNSHGGPERRKNDAAVRKAGYDALTIEQKLAQLPPDGAARQRARLNSQLAASLAKQKELPPGTPANPVMSKSVQKRLAAQKGGARK